MKRAIRWTVINSLFAAAMYFAFVEQVQGAQNIVLFYSWFAFVISLFAIWPPVWKKLAENSEGLTPEIWRVIDVVYDTIVVIVFVWVGWFATAAAYLIHIVLMQNCITMTKQHVFDLLKEKENVA